MGAVGSDHQETAGCPFHHEAVPIAKGATIQDPQILSRPNAFYRGLRTQDPVHYDPKLDMYLVSRFEDLQTVLRDPLTFSVAHGYEEQYAKGFAEEFNEILICEGGGFFEDIIMKDPPEHTRPRRLMEKAFTAHRVQTLEPRMTSIVVEQIEHMARKLADDGVVDAIKEFAAPVTVKMICDQLGFDQFDVDKVQRWSVAATSTIARMNSREQMLEHAREMSELQLYLIKEIRSRQEHRTEDLLSDLVYAEIDDSERPTLSFEEVVALSRPMLVAGNETTATALGNLLYILATQPAIAQTLREAVDDERLMNRFVEEILRIEPPVRGLSRMTTKEVELGDVKLPAHAHLLLLYASANDDETEFACPREFNLDRPNLGRHVAFGGGVHRCIGAPLARMEIKVTARELIKRLDKFELGVSPDEITYLPTIATRSIASLPLKFTRRS